jgi:hypothetical protein
MTRKSTRLRWHAVVKSNADDTIDVMMSKNDSGLKACCNLVKSMLGGDAAGLDDDDIEPEIQMIPIVSESNGSRVPLAYVYADEDGVVCVARKRGIAAIAFVDAIRD